MAEKNRKTLKTYFEKGAMPSAEHFATLIDSTLNKQEDGIERNKKEGFKISSFSDYPTLFSFFKDSSASSKAVCSVDLDGVDNSLILSSDSQRGLLDLDLTQNRVGINTTEPKYDLDVQGVVAAKGNIGTYKQGFVPADGSWHAISDELYGCHGFQITAGVGQKQTGKYALIRATALNSHNPRGIWFNLFGLKNRIKCQHAYYRSRVDKLSLRWNSKADKYWLEIKSNSAYSSDIRIRYHLSQLWFDFDMSTCQNHDNENSE